jgi:hypothetical protein
MAHTVIIDEAERDRRFVNHLNEILRHCRIGRVRAKTPPVFKRGDPFRGLPVDEPFKRYWKPDPMKPQPAPFWSGGYVHPSRTDDVPIVPSHGVVM